MNLPNSFWDGPSPFHNLHHKSMSKHDGSEFFAIKIVSPPGWTFEQALAHIAEHWVNPLPPPNKVEP